MDFHTVKSKKAKANARYNRLKNIVKIWRFFEGIVAVFVLSFAGDTLAYVCKYTYSPLATFLIFNSIIALLLLLSSLNRAEEENDVIKMVVFEESDFVIPTFSRCFAEDDMKMVIFSETDKKNEFSQKNGFLPSKNEFLSVKNDFLPLKNDFLLAKNDLKNDFLLSKNEFLPGKKDFLLASNDFFPTKSDSKNDLLSARVPACGAEEEREKKIVVVERDKGEKAVMVAIEEAKKQIRRFERRQLEILKRDLTSRHHFRRSETEKAISVVSNVDTLSSEDFQRTIEEFIAKQQKFLLDQKRAEKQLE